MAYRTSSDADDLFAYEQAREADGWASLAGYTDASGNQFESYDAACAYYGVDTPAQCAAEDAYWAEVEADLEAQAWLNEALVISRPEARCILNAAAFDPDLVEECPF